MTTKRTDELEPGDVIQVGGRWRIVRSRTRPAGSLDWDLEVDPPPVEIPPGPLRRPSSEKWFIREDGADLQAFANRVERENPYLPDGYRRKLEQHGRRAGKSSSIPPPGMGFGDFVIEFNSLTGDLTITSRTETIVVEPVRPGRIRLTSKRHDPNVGVKV